MPNHHGIPAVLTRDVVVSAPTMRNSPCAMLTTRISPKMTANPTDARTRLAIAENAEMQRRQRLRPLVRWFRTVD